MKKAYTKPSLEVIAFEVNEAVATCSVKLGNFANSSCVMDEEFKMLYDGYDISELFGSGEDCSVITEGYCYFTSVSNALILLNS